MARNTQATRTGKRCGWDIIQPTHNPHQERGSAGRGPGPRDGRPASSHSKVQALPPVGQVWKNRPCGTRSRAADGPRIIRRNASCWSLENA